ncbi:MAG: Polysaccharide deacetylase [Smithella sp. PtaU1.Bin162]|nr:MAG: Polysaccharide deacetylase [Smithella sp. PtaU1.Bin162]
MSEVNDKKIPEKVADHAPKNIFLYPEDRLKALTMSYDNGGGENRRLIKIFNRYGIKGTFHLNSGLLNKPIYVLADKVVELYRGHEVSCHGCSHASLYRIGREEIVREMWDDRLALENLVGYPVRGMSYANGRYNREAVNILKNLGFVYGRTVLSTENYNLPDDFITWNPTCHHFVNTTKSTA